MHHWLIDTETKAPSGFLEAFPEMQLFSRSQAADIPKEMPGIQWCRMHSGEAVMDALPPSSLGATKKVVLLCDVPDETLVMQALSAGAVGCCNTYAAPEVLHQVALVVVNGGFWIGQSLLQRLVGTTSQILGRRPHDGNVEEWSSRLSEREVQVARMVAIGASNKEIAEKLSITERTVKAHLTSIFEKLGLRDRLQLSVRVNGLTL